MQLFALRKVYEAQRTVFEFPAFDCWEKPWLRQRLQIEKELKSAVTALRRKETALLKLLRLLLLIEDRYLPEMVGMIKGYGGRSDGNQSWYAWKDAFDAGRSLKESGLTLEDVRELRREYAQSGWLVDPNREWFTLLNHSLASHRGKLKGKALLAWDYYQVAEILGRFLKDVTDEVQPHIDDLVTGTGGWKKNVYGIAADEFDYQSGSSLTSVLRYFGLDPRTRVLLLVEGETEMAFTKVWFERQRLLAQSLRINIVNLAGFASLTHRMTKELLRHARDDKACTVIAVDGDVNVRDHLNTLLEDNLIDGIVDSGTITAQNGLPIGAVVWESCFEDANFSPDELCEAWKIVTKPSKQNRGAADNAVAAAILSAKSQVTSRPVGSFVKALSSAATQEGLTFNKPEVGRALAERYWDTERPYCILLAKMVQIAQFLNTGRYSAPAPGAADETGAQFRRIIE